MKLFKLIFLILLFIKVNESYAVEENKIIIEWDNIPFAKEYILEIKSTKGKLLYKKKSQENKIALELEPGNYEKRIAVVNKLGEIDTVSNWSPFLVQFAEGKIKVIQKWEEVPGAVFYILEVENEEGKTIQKRKTNLLEVEIGLNPGNYKKKLTALNKLGEEEIKSDWIPFSVIEIFTPELKNPNTKETIEANKKDAQITVNGFHFESGIEVLLESKSNKVPISNLKIESKEKMILTIDIENALPGLYALKMKNTRSKQSSYNDYLKLEITPNKLLSKNLQNWEILLRSAAFSGWGETFAGNNYKNSAYQKRGYIYSGLFIVSGVYLLKLINDFQKESKNFNKDTRTNLAITAGTPEEFDTARSLLILNSADKIFSSHTNLQSISKESQKVSYFLVGIYLIQLIDSYFINRNVNRLFEASSSGLNIDMHRETLGNTPQKPQENVLLYYRFRF